MAVRGTSTPTAPAAPIVPLAPKASKPQTVGTSALAPEPQGLPLEGTIDSPETALLIIKPENLHDLFTLPGALNPILADIATRARSLVTDVSTKRGRDQIASLAYSVAKTKTKLEAFGKELNAKLKELPKLVDANKKQAWDFLEALQAEVRKPLTDYEAEQARVEAQRVADEAAAALARAIESDHEIALVLNRAYDRDKWDEAEALERAVRARELEIAAEAQEAERKASAQREADAAAAVAHAEQDRLAADQRAKDAEARAEQERKDAAARAEQAKKDAEARAATERQAAAKREEQARAEATRLEQARVAAAQKAESTATAAREKDEAHRKVFNQEALADLVQMTGLSEELAKKVIVAVAMKRVRHIAIAY